MRIAAGLLAGALVLILAGTGSTPTNRGDSESIWTAVLRDEPARLRGVPLSLEAERNIGAGLVLAAPASQRDGDYLRAVSAALLAGRRTQRRLTIHIDGADRLRWPVALPGGHVTVPVRVLEVARNEAEVAHLIAYAMVESDAGIAAEHYLRAKDRLPKAGWEQLRDELETGPLNAWEAEVIDREATRWAMAAGYWPRAGIEVLERTYMGQTAAGQLRGRHIYVFERTPVSKAVLNREQKKDTRYYLGRQNLKDRTARSEKEWPGEWFSRENPPPVEPEACVSQ